MKSIKATSRSMSTCASFAIQRTIGTNRTLPVSSHRIINHPKRLINSRRQCQNRYRSTTTAENNTISAEGSKGEALDHASSSMSMITPPPSARQLMVHALRSAVPMIGFGFMDNTIMIHAGHYVDCTLGVTFGLSTLAAAGIGQIFSGIGGVVFGDALDNAFRRMLVGNNGSSSVGSSVGSGVNSCTSSSGTSNNTKMTMNSLQKHTRASRLAGLTGGIFGVTLGCTLGLVNLLFVDEHRATLLKLRALEEGQEFEFEVEVDNERRAPEGYTTVIVRGPDVDGVLASITAAIASMGCSVVELHAGVRNRKGVDLSEDQESVVGSSGGGSDGGSTSSSSSLEDNSSPSSNAVTALLDQWIGAQSSSKSQSSSSQTSSSSSSSSSLPRVEDVFLIRRRSTHQPIENEDLDELARAVLAAAKDPLNSHSLKSQVDELTVENMALAERIEVLEGRLEDGQIRVVPSSSASVVVATGDGKEER
mmetsp:Transcript_4598/g.7345  ORF Transcript_4598/g.7345 Transcript_4598/m.7345 type:complete len:478 (+) Transcript_4598:97-1530(+)